MQKITPHISPKNFDYHQPPNLEEAIALTQSISGEYRFIAGGTDFMPHSFNGLNERTNFIDLSEIHSLQGFRIEDQHFRIGPLTKLDEVRKNPDILELFSALSEAAHSVGSPLIRKMGTIGGNILCENRCLYYNQSKFWRDAIGNCLKCEGEICIASGGTKACFSEFISDTAPALIVLGAEVEIRNESGSRTCKLEEIYTSEGVSPRNLSSSDILTAILLPLNRNFQSRFHKLRQRESLEFTALTTAVTLDKQGKVKICLAGISPGPVIVEGESTDTIEELAKAVSKQVKSVENNMFGRKYRKEMTGTILRRLLIELGLK